MKKITQKFKILFFIIITFTILFKCSDCLNYFFQDNKNISPLFSRDFKEVPSDIFITPSQLKQKLRINPNLILIDTRVNNQYNNLKIPNSIHMPIYSIKTKSFLKNSQLVLINEGYAYDPLIEEVKQLVNQGFRFVRVLHGGIKSWYKSGGKLIGDLYYMNNLSTISINKFLLDKDYQNVRIIIVIPHDKNNYYYIPDAISIRWRENNLKKNVENLCDHINQTIEITELYTIIIDNDGSLHDSILANVEQKVTSTIFFLENGINGIKEYLASQSSQKSTQQKKTRNQKCPYCN